MYDDIRRLALLALATLLLSFPLAAPAQSVPPGVLPGWFHNTDLSRRAAASQRAPTLIYINSRSARPCKQMEETTFADKEVAAKLNSFVRVWIAQEWNPEFLAENKIVRVPTVIFRDLAGNELDRATGFKDPKSFQVYLDQVLKRQGGAGGQNLKIGAQSILMPTPGARPFPFRFYAPQASSVHLIGDFNDWVLDATLMDRNDQGLWTKQVYLPEGTYEYLYLIDGVTYRIDDLNPYRKPSATGTVNSVLFVGTPKTMPIVQGRSVTFMFYHATATEVQVAGNFNNWSGMPLYRKPDDPGMWGMRVDLMPGNYSYKFVVDGEWTLDPENFQPTTDTQGTMNSSFVVR